MAVDVGPAATPSPTQLTRRGALAESIGLTWDRVAVAGAVHGSTVGMVTNRFGLIEGCDGLFTDRVGVGLFAVYADCYPIVLRAPGAVGLAHAGWRGSLAGISIRLVEALSAMTGTDPGALSAEIGPGICQKCYQVGPEFAATFPAEALAEREGGLFLDLAQANVLQLLGAGLRPEEITVDPRCTFESSDLPSHRRTGDATRLGILVAVKPRVTRIRAPFE